MRFHRLRPALLAALLAALAGAPRDVWQLEAAPGEEDLGASFPEERTAKFERQRSPHSRLWAFSEDPRDSEGDASSSSEGRRQRVSQHSQVTSREDLLKKAATAHSQSLEELLDRGMSLGAMAKVAAESERKSVYEEITRYAKRAAEVCALDETAQECLEAREEAKDHSLLKMPETRIGVYSEEKAKDAAGEETGEETGVAGGPLPSSRSPTTSVDALNAKAFVQVGSIGAIWDTLFGGAGAGNAENFEGGNQGSYFNFMYPSDNDFPWACLCDESQYKQWELGQVSYVSCRNQVDLSAQNSVPMCNPKNHKMNAALRAAPSHFLAAGAFVFAVLANV